MATKPTYYELLKHPKWQEMRLRILERDEFTCRWCFDKETTLNVHHTFYEKGASPWEYPKWSMITLCESCHEIATDLQTRNARLFGSVGRSESDLQRLHGYAAAISQEREVQEEPRACHLEVNGMSEMRGVADYLGLTVDEVFALGDVYEDGVMVGFNWHDLKAKSEKKQALFAQFLAKK